MRLWVSRKNELYMRAQVLAGEKAFNKTGQWLPTETLDAFKKYLVR